MKHGSEARQEEEREPSGRSADLIPGKGDREGLAHKSLRLSCSSEQVSDRPAESREQNLSQEGSRRRRNGLAQTLVPFAQSLALGAWARLGARSQVLLEGRRQEHAWCVHVMNGE